MTTNAISTENLSKVFDSVRALDDLTVDIPAGCIFGFLGPNGAGKTTTIQLLLGLIEPSHGNANVLGFDIRQDAEKIRAKTGALLEHSGIYEQMSAEDNLEFYGRVFRMAEVDLGSRIDELLKHMGLWERRKDRAGNWSRGMKQKLALARTLLHRPQLVLLDEPTAGLDVASAIAFREDLEALAVHEKVTIFLTSHNMSDVEKLCSQIAIIKEGKVVVHGSPDSLQNNLVKSRLKIIGRDFSFQVLQELQEHPLVLGISRKNGTISIDMAPNCDSAALVGYLVDHGTQIDEVYREKATLEEVFIAYTGGEDGN